MSRSAFLPGGGPGRRRKIKEVDKAGFATTAQFLKRFPNKSLKNYVENLEQYLGMGKGVVIGGKLGSGKTTVLANLMHFASAFFASHAYVPMGHLMLVLEYKTEESMVPYMYPGLLAVDDLDEIPDRPWVLRRFRGLLQQRADKRLPTMVTTALSQKPLVELIGGKMYEILRTSSEIILL